LNNAIAIRDLVSGSTETRERRQEHGERENEGTTVGLYERYKGLEDWENVEKRVRKYDRKDEF
jgi:hypothetical protein